MRDKGQMGGDLICPDNKASRLLAFLSPFSLELRTMRTKGAFAGSCFVARRRGGSRLRARARGRSQEPPQPQLAESGGVIRTLGSAVGVATICSSHAARGGGTKACSFVLVQRSQEPQQPQLAESTWVNAQKAPSPLEAAARRLAALRSCSAPKSYSSRSSPRVLGRHAQKAPSPLEAAA